VTVPVLETPEKKSPAIDWANIFIRGLASTQLGVILMMILAGVLVVATLIEKDFGHDYTLWYVYRSQWFITLVGLLAANVLAAIIMRYPWRRGQWSSLIAHAGVLVLLFGATQTYYYGMEGSLSIAEGDKTSEFTLADQCRLTVGRQSTRGGDKITTSSFLFLPGPVEWPEGKSLHLGYINGVGLTVLRYLPHAEVQENWLPDATDKGFPALEIALLNADGMPVQSSWLAGDPFGGGLSYGSLKLELQKAGMNSLVEEFLHPPENMDKDGVLAIHYQNWQDRIPVSENLGKKIPVGDSGIEVEITDYLPNAQSAGAGASASTSIEPLNPRLNLQIYMPGQETPLRQIAFAKQPLLNFEQMHGDACPVKFWYHHPAIAADPGIEFMQTPDNKLYYRTAVAGKYIAQGEVRLGDELKLGERLLLKVQKHLPAARQEVNFLPEESPQGTEATGDAAVLVEVDAEGATRQVWLRRNDPDFAAQRFNTPEGPLMVVFGYESIPLGFSLKLVNFEHGMNPGRVGDASFASTVELVDRAESVDEQRVISMNHPLVHGNYLFYQSSYQGATVSTLGVAYDPGRLAKHLGSVIVCLGMLMMLFKGARVGRKN
jgi:hypothetical protein